MSGSEELSRRRRGEDIHLIASPETTDVINKLRQYFETTDNIGIYRKALALLRVAAELEQEGYIIAGLRGEPPFSDVRKINLH